MVEVEKCVEDDEVEECVDEEDGLTNRVVVLEVAISEDILSI